MFKLQVLILAISLAIFYYWKKRKPLRDFAANIAGCDGLPFIGVLYKAVFVKEEGLKKLVFVNSFEFGIFELNISIQSRQSRHKNSNKFFFICRLVRINLLDD